MDLSSRQRLLLFVVIVVALCGLGYFLISGRHAGASTAPPAPAASSSTPPPAASPGVPPATVPAPTPAATAGGTEIYQWLPFTAAELESAAQVTQSFAAAYATWSYTESESAYGAKLQGLVTPTLLATLENDYGTAGVAGPRVADKQVSTGSGTIVAITAFSGGPTSITFSVSITQQQTSTQPPQAQTGDYAITVVATGTGWQVNDIELTGLVGSQ